MDQDLGDNPKTISSLGEDQVQMEPIENGVVLTYYLVMFTSQIFR